MPEIGCSNLGLILFSFSISQRRKGKKLEISTTMSNPIEISLVFYGLGHNEVKF